MPNARVAQSAIVAAITVLAAGHSTTLASVDYTLQDRSVSASQHGPSGPDGVTLHTVTAPDFGPFSALAQAYTGLFGGNPIGNRASGEQSSSLNPDSVHFGGTVFASSIEAFVGSSRAQGDSSLTVHFTIMDPTPFMLQAESDATPGMAWLHPDAMDFARIALRHIGGATLVDASVDQFGQPGSSPLTNLSLSGTLQPGEYEFIAVLTRRAATAQNYGGGTSHLSATLQLPTPGAGGVAILGLMLAARRRR
jgi:hypothetical protein